jgi:CHAT domain-containing protein
VAGLNSQVIRFAEGDAREAAAVLHTQAITGSAATPDAILRGLPGADWIHLSTHGTLVQTNPYLSYLELSGGTVSAWQVFTAVNQAEFLILTACDS